MNPVIFYRVSKPSTRESLASLPSFKTADFFEKEKVEEDKTSKIAVLVRKKDIKPSELDIELSDSAV